MKRVFLVAVLVAVVVAVVWMYSEKPQAKPPVAPPVVVPPLSPSSAPPVGDDAAERKISFENNTGVNAGLLRVNEGVTGAGNVRVATRQVGDARWVLLLTPGVQKYASLDGAWKLSDFPELVAADFQEPPPPILRGMSIHRSLTRAEMKSAAAGDRIVVLVCPKEEWDRLNLRWPRTAGF